MERLPLTWVDLRTKLLSNSVFLDLKNTEVVLALLSFCWEFCKALTEFWKAVSRSCYFLKEGAINLDLLL